MQAAEPGQGPAKTPGITLGTKTGESQPEQSGWASRAGGGEEPERQVWERDSTSSELPPNTLRSLGRSLCSHIARPCIPAVAIEPTGALRLLGGNSKARGAVGGAERGTPGSVHLSVCPPCRVAQHSPDLLFAAGGKSQSVRGQEDTRMPGWWGQGPACTPLAPHKPPWLLWQTCQRSLEHGTAWLARR